MRRFLVSFISAVLIITGVLPEHIISGVCADIPEISAKSAVLISADTGEIIFEKDCRKKLPMASTTKIMTVLLTIESGGLYEEFVVDSEAIKVEGSSMGLREGDTVTKYALCVGMLLPSGNDAANAAAVRIAGSIPAFADMMNCKARELGLSHTFFVTPSGLEGEGHGSSAFDMAILAREALRNDVFSSICSQQSMEVEFGAPPYRRWLKNTNKLLSMCEGVYGVKTGFTDEAGRCLVSACERDGKKLICVTLNDRNDWEDHAELYGYGFSVTKTVKAELPPVELDIVGGTSEKIPLRYGIEDVDITIRDVMPDLEYTVISPPFVYAPAAEGDEVASMRISWGGREIASVPLYAAENVPQAPQHSRKKTGKLRKFVSKLRKIFF